MALYPGNALVLSYCGWLQAKIDKKYHSGIALCRKAFVEFKPSDPHTAGIVYPILYLNMGRAFLLAGKKKEAVENFNKGLKHDRSNIEIKKEMKLLGTRKKPLVPFLSRSNPINKYIGMLLHESRTSLLNFYGFSPAVFSPIELNTLNPALSRDSFRFSRSSI